MTRLEFIINSTLRLCNSFGNHHHHSVMMLFLTETNSLALAPKETRRRRKRWKQTTSKQLSFLAVLFYVRVLQSKLPNVFAVPFEHFPTGTKRKILNNNNMIHFSGCYLWSSLWWDRKSIFYAVQIGWIWWRQIYSIVRLTRSNLYEFHFSTLLNFRLHDGVVNGLQNSSKDTQIVMDRDFSDRSHLSPVEVFLHSFN